MSETNLFLYARVFCHSGGIDKTSITAHTSEVTSFRMIAFLVELLRDVQAELLDCFVGKWHCNCNTEDKHNSPLFLLQDVD